MPIYINSSSIETLADFMKKATEELKNYLIIEPKSFGFNVSARILLPEEKSDRVSIRVERNYAIKECRNYKNVEDYSSDHQAMMELFCHLFSTNHPDIIGLMFVKHRTFTCGMSFRTFFKNCNKAKHESHIRSSAYEFLNEKVGYVVLRHVGPLDPKNSDFAIRSCPIEGRKDNALYHVTDDVSMLHTLQIMIEEPFEKQDDFIFKHQNCDAPSKEQLLMNELEYLRHQNYDLENMVIKYKEILKMISGYIN